ncbi:MAG: hypothetical protein V5A36_05750 [Natronomonas sp.]
MASPAPPPVPEADLEARGWARSDDRTETVFEGLGVTVESRTLVYEDQQLRTAVVEAGGPDRIWRFLFVSGLEITPPPAFGMHAAIRPHVNRESKRAFAEELHERGIENVAAGETNQIELAGDTRARMTPYRGTITVEGSERKEPTVEILGRLALWYDTKFYIAGCAGPSGAIDGWVDVDTDGETLASLIRTVA